MKKLKLLGAICMLTTVVACDSSKPEERKEAPSTKGVDETRYVDPTKPAEKAPDPVAPAGSAAGSAADSAATGSAGSAATGSATTMQPASDLPAECQDYKATVDKMSACEKFGAQKQSLTDAFTKSWEAWGKLPADGKAKLAAECKKSAETIKSVGKAACGW